MGALYPHSLYIGYARIELLQVVYVGGYRGAVRVFSLKLGQRGKNKLSALLCDVMGLGVYVS